MRVVGRGRWRWAVGRLLLALGASGVGGAIVWAVVRFGLEQADQAAGVIGSVAGLTGLGVQLLATRSSEAAGASPGREWVSSAAGLSGYQPPQSSTPVRGRETELSTLHRLAKGREGGGLAVICGTGGLGKTTLAAEFARRAQRAGKAVFWVRWQDDAGLLADDLTRVAQALGLSESAVADAHSGRAVLVDTVWGHLAVTRGWVVVVDNVDTPGRVGPGAEPLANYRGWLRPDGGGLLLVTSRDTSTATWGTRAHLIALEPLAAADAGAVLLQHAPTAGTPEEARALGVRLGGLPLALDAAGRYLAQPTSRHRTFSSYRNALEAEFEDLLGAAHPGASDPEIARTVVRHTWELSLAHLEDEGYPLTRPLLHLLALLELAPIPRSLITPALLSDATGATVTAAEIDTALAGLHRYGLLSGGTSDGDPAHGGAAHLALHPLVRDVMALTPSETDNTTTLGALDHHLLQAAQEAAEAGRAGTVTALLLSPHLPPVLDRGTDGSLAESTVDALADALRASGHPAEERHLREHVLNVSERTLGTDHPDTLASRNNLANALGDLGHHQEAAELHRTTLTAYERALGTDHPDTLTSRNNLANALHGLGHHQEAAELHRTTLHTRQRTLGTDHPDTLTSRNNLANALNGLCQHQEAAELHRTTLTAYEHTLGTDHPGTLTSRHNLANALHELGHHQEAAELHRTTLSAYEHTLGTDHPHTLASRNNLAVTLYDLGHHEEAAELHRTVLTAYERTLGPDHPHTLASRDNLAFVEASTPAPRPRRWPRRR
ncbi:tetratricopeptide repeat protein [Streptomyces albidoflavus]|uniref:tetratricopeptide repeat protein n=1 Tax=Streptomyces albidoflavus TaxID=1886 RepID=UPI0033B2EC27